MQTSSLKNKKTRIFRKWIKNFSCHFLSEIIYTYVFLSFHGVESLLEDVQNLAILRTEESLTSFHKKNSWNHTKNVFNFMTQFELVKGHLRNHVYCISWLSLVDSDYLHRKFVETHVIQSLGVSKNTCLACSDPVFLSWFYSHFLLKKNCNSKPKLLIRFFTFIGRRRICFDF